MEIPGKFPANHTYYNYGYYLLTQPLHSLHSHAQPSVVMTTRLTNVYAEPNSESACVAIFGSISVWAWNRAISGSWRAESETRSAKRHVTAARREYESRDCRASEFEMRISVASVSHVIFACRESERRASEFKRSAGSEY